MRRRLDEHLVGRARVRGEVDVEVLDRGGRRAVRRGERARVQYARAIHERRDAAELFFGRGDDARAGTGLRQVCCFI